MFLKLQQLKQYSNDTRIDKENNETGSELAGANRKSPTHTQWHHSAQRKDDEINNDVVSNKHTYGKNKSRPLSHTIYEKQLQIDCIPVDYSVSHQDSDHEGALQNKYYGKKGGKGSRK